MNGEIRNIYVDMLLLDAKLILYCGKRFVLGRDNVWENRVTIKEIDWDFDHLYKQSHIYKQYGIFKPI